MAGDTTGTDGFQKAEHIKEAIENMKEYRKLVKEAAGNEQLLIAAAEKLDVLSVSILENKQAKLDAEKEALDLAKTQLENVKQITTLDAATQQKRVAALTKEIKLRKKAHDARVAQQEEISEAEQKASNKKRATMTLDYNKADELRKVSNTQREDDHKMGIDTLKSLAMAGTTVAREMGVVIGSVLRSPELAMGLMFTGLTTGIEDIQREIKRMPAGLDKAITGMVKSTGLPVKQLGDTLVNALDPEYAKRIGVEFGNIPKPLKDIGLTAKDVGASVKSLVDNMAMFRPSFMQNNKAASAFLTNTVAGMAKLGVKTGTSAKILNTFTKALKKTPVEAGKSLKSIANVADSLGLNMGTVVDNFSQMSPKLAMFGDDMVDVFADLQAQAQGTGVEMNKLLGVAMKMDTFEGAAKHAQSLNAVLGQSAISITDLVHADPADKIAMIQDAIANAGIDFETADRRMRQVIATAAGFDNVEDAAKVLLNKEDAEASAAAVDTATMSQSEFSKKVTQSLTVAEKMKKGLSSMAGGMKKILNTVQPGALRFSKTMTNAFGNIQKSTKDSAASVLAFSGGISAIVSSKAAAQEALKGLADTMGTFADTTPDWLKKALAIGAVGVGAVGASVLVKGAADGVTEPDSTEFDPNAPEAPDGADTAAASRLRTDAAQRQHAMAAAEADPDAQQVAGADKLEVNLNLDGTVIDKRTVEYINGALRLIS